MASCSFNDSNFHVSSFEASVMSRNDLIDLFVTGLRLQSHHKVGWDRSRYWSQIQDRWRAGVTCI